MIGQISAVAYNDQVPAPAYITAPQLLAGMPRCPNPAGWAEALNVAMARFEIKTVDEIAEFLGQIAVESGELTRLDENLNYKPERLVVVWPTRFANVAAATPYAGSSHKLADHVYANRGGNGDEASGDGYRYRGRGPIMVTFKDGYAHLQKVLGLPFLETPDMLCTKGPGALAAGLFWSDNKLNALADVEDTATITRKVNGGKTGLAEREKYFARFKQILGEGN